MADPRPLIKDGDFALDYWQCEHCETVYEDRFIVSYNDRVIDTVYITDGWELRVEERQYSFHGKTWSVACAKCGRTAITS